MAKSTGKKVKILSHEYDLIVDEMYCSGEGVQGQCRFMDGKMYVNPKASDAILRETLMHEIFEALSYHFGVKWKHDDLCRMSEGVCTMLHDNDFEGLVEYIVKESKKGGK